MSLKTEFFLGWRYFKPKRSAVSVITLISVIGVVLGVAVLIVVLAVMTGFTDRLKEKLIETGAHGQIRKVSFHTGTSSVFHAEEAESLTKDVESLGGDAVPVLLSPVLLQVGDSFMPKGLIAFDPETDRHNRAGLRNAITQGTLSLKKGEVILSEEIAASNGVGVGDKIILHSPTRLSHLIEKDPQTGRFRAAENAEYYLPGEYTVTALFSFGKYDFDKDVLFLGLDDADALFGLEWGTVTHVYLWVDDPFDVKPFLKKLRDVIRNNHPTLRTQVLSWQDMNQRILDVLQVEKSMQFFLLIFIVLVAAFSIANTLITTVIQKTREIGLLKAMGAPSFSIMRIFLLQGAFVGILGTAGGVLLGWLVVIYRLKILAAMRFISGQEIFPRQVYLFNELPAHIIWTDVLTISVISILLCTAGALLPALRAAHLDPARALRYE